MTQNANLDKIEGVGSYVEITSGDKASGTRYMLSGRGLIGWQMKSSLLVVANFGATYFPEYQSGVDNNRTDDHLDHVEDGPHTVADIGVMIGWQW